MTRRIDLDESLLIYATRGYALGRMTYAASDVVDEIVRHARILEPNTRHVLLRDIREAIEEGRAGSRCDIEAWERAVRALEEAAQ